MSNRVDWSTARWRKSVVSDDGGCVEVARVGEPIGVRDTKAHGAGSVLEFNLHEWSCFLAGVRSGEFDLDQMER